ncbi:MAG: hypothetical protein JNN12_17195 [Bacteroidetes Order II. Incertae sedis bacterium]|nr:hypothetical protein [Bacteroidetes Order II. bacterium]
MQQTDHAFPLFATAQNPNARKSGKARRLLLSVGSNGNGRHHQDQTDRKNEQTMTQDKDLVFAQRTFFCFSATAQVAHLVLPDTQRQRFTKPKEPIFSNALSTAFQNFTNFATK